LDSEETLELEAALETDATPVSVALLEAVVSSADISFVTEVLLDKRK
jgi:hypothetical protein